MWGIREGLRKSRSERLTMTMHEVRCKIKEIAKEDRRKQNQRRTRWVIWPFIPNGRSTIKRKSMWSKSYVAEEREENDGRREDWQRNAVGKYLRMNYKEDVDKCYPFLILFRLFLLLCWMFDGMDMDKCFPFRILFRLFRYPLLKEDVREMKNNQDTALGKNSEER